MSHVSPVVQLSIDLGLRSNQTALLQHQQLETVTQNLLAWIAEYRLPTTWAFPHPAGSDIVPTLQSLDTPQEIALLANSSWADASNGRSTFARGISQRMNEAQQRGLKITTLAASDTDITDHFDLLVKEQITIVRVGSLRRRPRRTVEMVRHGVWRVTPTMGFPASSYMARLNWIMAQHRLGRRMKLPTTEHVLVVAADLLEANRSRWRSLDQFFRRLSKLTQSGQIQMQTLGQAAQKLQPTRHRRPSRSILRPAA